MIGVTNQTKVAKDSTFIIFYLQNILLPFWIGLAGTFFYVVDGYQADRSPDGKQLPPPIDTRNKREPLSLLLGLLYLPSLTGRNTAKALTAPLEKWMVCIKMIVIPLSIDNTTCMLRNIHRIVRICREYCN